MDEHQETTTVNQAAAVGSGPDNQAAAAAKKRTLAADSGDKIMALGMFVLAFVLSDTFGLFVFPGLFGMGVTAAVLLYAACLLWYIRKKARQLPREAYFWLAIMVAGSLPYTLVYNQSLLWFHPLFLRLTMLYATAVSLHALLQGKTGNFLIFDGINMAFLIPFRNFDAQWSISGREIKNMKFVSSILKAILGLLVAVPLLLIVTSLLASADDRFGELLVDLSHRISGDVFRVGWTFVWSLPVGCFLFGLFYGAVYGRGKDAFKTDEISGICKAFGVIPAASIYAILSAVSVIYLLFIGLQGGYYLSALRGVLPAGFTYSEYARQGFFELVKVSLINLGILGAVRLLCNRQGVVLRGLTLLLSVLTLFLIGTAMTKMLLYIEVYGLTPLRVIPSIFMIFLTLIFILIIISQFRQVPIVRLSLCAFAIGYTALSLANMDGIIARYNLSRYEAGTLSDIPGRTLTDGSLASIPAMYELWVSTDDPEVKAELSRLAIIIKEDSGQVRSTSRTLRYGGNIAKNKAIDSIAIMTD